MKETLATLMQQSLPAGGVMVPGARDLHMEVKELATGTIWMSLDPVSREDYAALELSGEYKPAGIAPASMDAALFKHSPNAAGSAVRERRISGRTFINVAEAGKIDFATAPGGMSEVMVNKAHVLGFEAGRTLAILKLPDGDFVETVGTPEKDTQLRLPPGARIEQHQLSHPWVVHLPTPTRTLWWFGDNPRSFQGPVTIPDRD